MKLIHKFVKFIPETIEEGILYISIDYTTAIHLCMCGCGNQVVTPISPVEWKIIFDGETVSLEPSIGNWNFKCKSHYWIIKNTIQWSSKWSKNKIKKSFNFHEKIKDTFYKK